MKTLQRLLIIALCLLIPSSAGSWGVVGMSGGVASVAGNCSTCNTTNDSARFASGITQTASATGVWTAWKFTVSTTTCITGGYVSALHNGAPADHVFEIWTDSSSHPGARVGAGYTSTVSVGTSIGDVEFNFAATQTLTAGSYWAVMQCSSDGVTGNGTSGSGDHMYSEDSGASWVDADAAGYYWRFGVNGCTL